MNKELSKEQAVFDKRYWLKISTACNNKCIFCLDADHKEETPFFPLDEIKSTIQEACDGGYTRLVVSGGEATIHPHFIDIIRYADKLGFQKIQVITNGRMFSYDSFAQDAVDAGLSEVTFSIHGHTAELHDTLTGIPSSFAQASRGIVNLQRTRRCIVNIDIVVNKLNYPHVEDIIKYFSRLGVYEYDLLHIVPFGKAFKNKERLFFSYNDSFDKLQKAFSYHKKSKYYIWTNRFPPQFLEGNETLIQDPHKLYDEILGRADLFEEYYREKKFHCYPDRCEFCFVKDICQKFIFHTQPISDSSAPVIIESEILAEHFIAIAAIEGAQYRLKTKCSSDNIKKIEQNKNLFSNFDSIEISCNRTDDISKIRNVFPATVRFRIYMEHIRDDFFSANVFAGDTTYIIPLNKENCEALLRNKPYVEEHAEKINLHIPGYETLSEVRSQLHKSRTVLREFPSIPTRNCPQCLHPKGYYEKYDVFSCDLVVQSGAVNLKNLVKDYIIHDYFVKSSRCDKCSHSIECKGLHINLIRHFGFSILQPIR